MLEDLLKVSSECENAAWKLQKEAGECSFPPSEYICPEDSEKGLLNLTEKCMHIL